MELGLHLLANKKVMPLKKREPLVLHKHKQQDSEKDDAAKIKCVSFIFSLFLKSSTKSGFA